MNTDKVAKSRGAQTAKKRKRKRADRNEHGPQSTIGIASFPPISWVECNIRPSFAQLAEVYPEFKRQWEDLKRRQKTKTVMSTRTCTGDRLVDDNGVSNSEAKTEIGTTSTDTSTNERNKNLSFSSHVNFEFNCALTRALLDKCFDLSLPSMPEGHLCPPVPNRFNYVLWIKRLLTEVECSDSEQATQSGPRLESGSGCRYFSPLPTSVKGGLILGTGSSCIYPLLLTSDQFSGDDKSWRFLGTEIDSCSIQCAQENINTNGLQKRIQIAQVPPTKEGGLRTTDVLNKDLCKLQEHVDEESLKNRTTPLHTAMKAAVGIFQNNQDGDGNNDGRIEFDTTRPRFDFCMTNPPFYSNEQEASQPRKGDERDRTDMSSNESIYPGGELGFALDMIYDSLSIRDDVIWYSLMLSRKHSLVQVEKELKRLGFGRSSIRTTEFQQGKTTRWGVAWTYLMPCDDSPAAKLVGGLKSFHVPLDPGVKRKDAVEDVVGRIEVFCQELKVVKIKCKRSDVDKTSNNKCCIIISPQHIESHELGEATKTLVEVDHFHIQVQVTCGVQYDDNESVKDDEYQAHNVGVSLCSYAAFDDGLAIVRKIHSLLQGEVCRVNRKWRRIRKRDSTCADSL